MKTIFTLTTIVMIIIATLVSIALYKHGYYTMSALLTIVSYVSSAFWIHVLVSKKVVLK